MLGGVVKVQRFDDDAVPPVPDVVLNFRATVNQLKRKILGALETKGNQDPAALDSAIDRIQHLGNILTSLVYTDNPKIQQAVADAIQAGGKAGDTAVETIKSIEDIFNAAGVNFDTMSTEVRALCIHYIKLDINMYPYDLSPPHINSVNNR